MRVAPGSFREIGPRAWVLAHGAGLVNGIEPMNLFRVLGKHPSLMRAWLVFARRLMPFGKLPRREAEIVILRVAHLAGSEYEHHQHKRLARRFGVTREEMERLREWPAREEEWTPRLAAILAAVEELHADRDLSDEGWQRLCEHLDEKERIELCMLAAHYGMLATVISALRIPVERPRRGLRS